MISYETWAGGTHAQAVVDAMTLSPRFARFWTLRNGTAGWHVRLEDPTVSRLRYKLGGWAPHLVIWNSGTGGGGGLSFDLKDSTGTTTLATLAVDEVATVRLVATSAATARSAWDVTAAQREWLVRKRARLT